MKKIRLTQFEKLSPLQEQERTAILARLQEMEASLDSTLVVLLKVAKFSNSLNFAIEKSLRRQLLQRNSSAQDFWSDLSSLHKKQLSKLR